MKYRHFFELTEAKPSYRIYRSEDISIRLDFFEHILRVAILRDNVPLIPTWSVNPGQGFPEFKGRDKLSTEGFSTEVPKVSETSDSISFSLDDVSVNIEKNNFRMHLTNEKGLLYEDREYISYNFGHELGKGSMHFISREENEEIFGLGDKTGNVNKNKLSFRLSTSDAMGFDASKSDPLYKHLPFYICRNSNGSYGMYYDTYSTGAVDFGREKNNYYDIFKSFKCDEENLVFYVILGTVPEIVRRFSTLTGSIMMPPEWTFKYCGSTMAYTDAPDADRQLRHFIELCEKYEISPGGFYMSSGYTQIGSKRYVFHWNLDKIPSPEDLSRYFKDHGVEFLPNIKPAFLTDHPLYKEIAEKGWFLHYKDGTPATFPFWSGFGSYLDFTNPEAFSFWSDCVKKELIDKGFKNPWNDNNEYDVCDTEVYAHGFGNGEVRASEIRPLFSFLMTLSSLSAQDRSVRTYAVSRSGIAGLPQIAATWTGDNNTDFKDFRYNHKMAMTMSLSGFFNFGQDIGGFAGPCPGRELFLRWIQYGLFTPRFTLHSWNPDGSSTMPWLYPEVMPTVKKLFDLRESFIPYLYNEAYRSTLTHDPIIYPVFLKYPGYDTEADCFFFGDSVLACPVFDEGAVNVTVDLPGGSGNWYYRDRLLNDAETVTFDAPLEGMPVWLNKAGSVLPIRENGETVFKIYALRNGSFSYDYLEDDGISIITENNHRIIHLEVNCTDSEITVKLNIPDKKKLTVIDEWNRKVTVIQ